MANQEFSPPLEIDLGNNPGPVIFHPLDEAVEWAKREVQTWQAAIGTSSNLADGGLSLLHEAVANAQLNRLSKLVIELAGAQSSNQQTTLDTAGNAIQEAFLPRGTPAIPTVVHSDSIDGRRILAAKPSSIPAMLAIKLGLPIVVSNRQQRSVDLTAFVNGHLNWRVSDPDDFLTATRSALEQQASEWQKQVADQRHLYEHALSEVRTVLADFESRIASTEARYQRIAKAAVAVATKQRDEHSKEMGAIRKRFEEEMRLRGPVGYWDKKRSSDSLNAWIIGTIFVAALIAIAVAAAKIAVPEIDRMIADAATASSGTQPGKDSSVYLTHLKIIVAVGIPAFLAFWILRIMSRLFHLNLSGAVDAAERITMVQTYLALYGEKKLEESDRILILQALFRQTSQTPDDSPPPNWFDILIQRMKTK
jgi:Family of unknown function (DUF6161)